MSGFAAVMSIDSVLPSLHLLLNALKLPEAPAHGQWHMRVCHLNTSFEPIANFWCAQVPGTEDHAAAVGLVKLCGVWKLQIAQAAHVAQQLVSAFHEHAAHGTGRSAMLVLEAVCSVGASVHPCTSVLQPLCTPLLQCMAADATSDAAAIAIDALAVVFKGFGTCAGAREGLLQLLQQAAHCASLSQGGVMDSILKLCHSAARSPEVGCEATSNALCPVLCNISHSVVAVQAAKNLTLISGTEPSVALTQLVASICETMMPNGVVNSRIMTPSTAAALCELLAVLPGCYWLPLDSLAAPWGEALFSATAALLADFALRSEERELGLAGLSLASAVVQTASQCERCGACATIVMGALLRAANGAIPSCMLNDVVDSLWQLREALTPACFGQLYQAALSLPDVPRLGVQQKRKDKCLEELASVTDRNSFKKMLKAFCGGKKKGEKD